MFLKNDDNPNSPPICHYACTSNASRNCPPKCRTLSLSKSTLAVTILVLNCITCWVQSIWKGSFFPLQCRDSTNSQGQQTTGSESGYVEGKCTTRRTCFFVNKVVNCGEILYGLVQNVNNEYNCQFHSSCPTYTKSIIWLFFIFTIWSFGY